MAKKHPINEITSYKTQAKESQICLKDHAVFTFEEQMSSIISYR